MAAIRVVLDTNVVVSALLFGGPATARLRSLWQKGACVPLVSAATAAELLRVLAYPKFRLSPAEREELLGDYLPFAEVVVVPDPPPEVPACRDVFDLPFLHLAAAGAATLVTGDRDLLVLAGGTAITIVRIEDFIAGFDPR
ncbi:putative toxin-antitoxin system toxin component, PIN family [Variovorax sp. J22P271]|uniref:putative toxin-antitoxin system toxin component, PIN family n=1 Tax=Variovorax davisae TaxID=3053515 RepID=UPI002576510F|nr:putative toxin-antitoxin system toxin component, PIN family [Variovorax sp. J22P271]MDM0033836.1 putative toxin-antitoxin system toxin component, PIN family [Variovorax sp. J22P271]